MTPLFVVILLIFLASIFQRKTANMMSGLIFIIPVWAHEVAGQVMGGWLYYISDVCLGLISIRILTMLKWSKLSHSLAKSALISMILNIAGVCVWYIGLSPSVYNILFLVLYSWVLFMMVSEGGLHVGFFETARDCAGLYRNALSRVCLGRPWKD